MVAQERDGYYAGGEPKKKVVIVGRVEVCYNWVGPRQN